MIDGLKPYAAYKGSGIEWCPSLPSAWATERAKWLFTKMARPVRPEDEVVTCFRDGMVTLRKNRRLRGFTEASVESGYQGIRKGDLVVHGMDAFAGAVGVSDSDGKGTPIYNVCQPREGVSAAYYAQAVREMAQSKWILALATGIRERSTDFRFEMFGNQFMPVPPPAEQDAIVRFLDWANSRLERTIRAKRRVIALLTEQKQALIHRAVTQGLDANVRRKASGISWVGEIPTHWDVLRSKYLFQEVDARSTSGTETHLSMSQKFGLIPNSQITVRRLVSETQVGAKLCATGDLVLNRLKAHLGVFALASQPGLISPDYTVLRQVREMDARYFEAVYRTPACRVELRQKAKGIVQGFWRLYTDDFYDIRLPVPPVDEQRRIVAQLDTDLSAPNTAISRLEAEILLLREYRTRLVADVVTGKLDVRDAVLHLPDDAAAILAEEPDDDAADDPELDPEEAIA